MNDGILIINKPQWYTSFDVIAKARKTLNTKKIGHTGTLDPMATGVLVLCVNKATSLVDVLTCEDKIYRTTIRLGVKTDTADMSGNIIEIRSGASEISQDVRSGAPLEPQYDRSGAPWAPSGTHLSDISKQHFESNLETSNTTSFNFTQNQIEEVLKSFIGESMQTPPMYSSIKINGKKLYEYARRGENVEVPARKINVFDIYDIEWNNKNEITYTVHCSKGTYIRALNEDIAKALGTIGTTMVLERIKTGKFSLKDAVDIKDISEDKIITIEKLFEDKIEITKEQEKPFLNGMDIRMDYKDGYYNIYESNKYIGVGIINNSSLKRFIIIDS